MTVELDVNLLNPPNKRWQLPDTLRDQARQLLKMYLCDLGDIQQFTGIVDSYSREFISPEYLEEMQSLADQSGKPLAEVIIANLYYDVLKLSFGCTAFAVDTPNGPLHARNLDWWTEENLLSEYTLVTWFNNGPTGPFATIGWPGFVGAFSGIAPGRFAVTLNAVLSNEPFALAKPITLLLRSVLESCRNFKDAVEVLTSERIASDCLLLITGPNEGQMVVVERTPQKAMIREAEKGLVIVTNDYLLIDSDMTETMAPIQETSCTRYECVMECLSKQLPYTEKDCLDILSNPSVLMGITVQQMVMSARSGLLHVELPELDT
jgi:hypothetical protein